MNQDNLKKCKVCGKTFKTENPRQKYCSDECYHESNRINALDYYHKTNPKYEHVCPICRKRFTPKHNGMKYCSDSCNKEAKRLNRRRHYLIKKMDTEYTFDIYTVKFNRYNEYTYVLKDGEVVGSSPHDLFNAFSDLAGEYYSKGKKEEFKRLKYYNDEMTKLNDLIWKIRFEFLPELNYIEGRLWL